MPDVIADVRKVIEDRLRELEAEAMRLRSALTSLGGDSRSPTGDRRSRATTRRSAGTGSRRAPRGQREAEFLAVLERRPGAKVPAIADEMGVPPSQVYGLARRLHQAGRIRKRSGGGYAPKA
jgi:sugar-specific transcriptional regulator TrmB